MGKTIKGKNKVAAKKAALAKKVARKCRGKCAAISVLIAFAALADLVSGCAQSGPQPSRAIYQRFNLTRCAIVVGGAATTTNNTPSVEMFTATQANEGSETMSPTSTASTDVRPDLDVTIPSASGISHGAATGAIETIIGAGAGKLARAINGTVQEPPMAASGACTDGSCTDGACTDCD